MSILHKLLALALVPPVVATGCSQKEAPSKEAPKLVKEKEPEEKVSEELSRLKKIPIPLKNLRQFVPGIHNFDRNKNEILEPEEVALLVKILVNDEKDEYTEEGRTKLKKIIDAIDRNTNVSRAESYEILPQLVLEGYDEWYHPNNIEQTLSNFDVALKQYESKFLDQVDREIENKIQRAEKKN